MTFEQELESCLPVLRRVAVRLTRDPEAAKDLVQSTVVRALEARELFRGGNLKAWLCRIQTNLFINGKIRSATRRRVLDRIHEDGHQVELVGRLPDPHEELERKAVMSAIGALPAQYREAMELVDLAGLRYKEAADSMRVPLGTVMSRLHRGRKLLAERLEAA